MASGEDHLGDVVAEVEAAFRSYEQALVAHDVDALNDAFVRDERAVRHGPDGSQYGYEAIAAWRAGSGRVPAGRVLFDTAVWALSRDVAVVGTEFGYPGSDVVGRQSQVWARTSGGWRIVHAHVSFQLPS